VYGNWTLWDWRYINSGIRQPSPLQVAALQPSPATGRFLAASPSTAAQAPCSLLMRWNLTSTRTLTLTSGTFDAVSYNVTAGKLFVGGGTSTLKMGSGTWTLTNTGSVWNISAGGNLTLYKGTADILLSNTSTAATRTFDW
jgi:hypothetical protein